MTAYLPNPFDMTTNPFDMNMLGFSAPGPLAFQTPTLGPGPIFYITHAPTVPTPPTLTLSHTGIPLKRGPEELGILTNGHGVHTPMEIEANESKKVRLENVAEAPPSKVVHIRNVPSDASEQDISLLGVPFGPMISMVMSKKVNQALLELETLDMSMAMVHYYSAHPPTIHGRTVIIQFSKHTRLETKTGNAAVEAALQTANQLVAAAQTSTDPKTVLRVIVDNTFGQAINYLVIYKIFHRFGRILRIIVFSRNGQFQCLIEFENSVSAHTAKLHLNGQNIYSGCCNLRVDFSKLKTLEVRTDSDKCRDFARCPLTEVERGAINSLALAPSPTAAAVAASAAVAVSNAQQLASPLAQLTQLSSPSGLPFSPAGSLISLAGLPPGAMQAVGQGNAVLLVSNLDEEKVTPDALFTLFGVYGDVIRVKIMFNKKDNALVQFNDAQQAQLAMENLNGIRLGERPLKITYSKHAQVQMPKEGADAGLTKDYSMTTLHRFKKPNSKNYQNIFPPSATLHLSNIPATTTETDLRQLFETKGFRMVNFKFMMKEKKMALVQLETVEDAVSCLIELHNWQLSDNYHLRVSFSKAII